METSAQEIQSQQPLESEQDEVQTDLCVDDEMMEPLHSKIRRDIIPRVGMEFDSEDAAYEFYNAYSSAVGFSVRRSKSHNYRGVILDRMFVCSCQGKRERDKRDDVYKSHRMETRCGCLALMKISCRQADKYRVVSFTAAHNHNLGSSRKVHPFRSHKKLPSSLTSDADMIDSSVATPPSGHEYRGIASLGCRNYLHRKRSLEVKPGDTSDVLGYLQSMKVEDHSFFYAIQVDEDDRITNIFWADAKMMVHYEDFGDVVCFDTTYRKHKDGRPIALFVGVNHHKQATIFGAALLYDESSESFVWLFDTFARAMGGKLPRTTLIDEDVAISEALAFQWPETHRRLCIWQTFQNAAFYLGGVFAKYKDFPRDLCSCMFDHEYEDDFLDAWSEMLGKYELQNNDWLRRLFSMKEKWALVYGREIFCGDMAATQRNERMNKLIKHYVSYKHDLKTFFGNFQRLLNDRRNDEIATDIKDCQGKVAFFPVAILKHAASVYTVEVFKLFQEEACKAYDCSIEVCGENGPLLKYKVTPYEKTCSYVVSCDDTGEIVSCTCRKFEFVGLLCSHILKVFSFRCITKLPSKYIMKRWTKNAKRGSVRVTSESLNVDGDPKTAMARRYKDLCRLTTRLLTRAAEVEGGYALVKEGLLKLLREHDLQHIIPSHLVQESQIVQLDGSALQDQSGYNYCTQSEFEQGVGES